MNTTAKQRNALMLCLVLLLGPWFAPAGWAEDTPPFRVPPEIVSAGFDHACGVRSNGTVICWGAISGSTANTYTQVSAGLYHTCGLKGNGTVACWGNNYWGQATSPAGIFIQVSAGDLHTCGVKSDGSVACWGDNEFGRATPPAVIFTQISAGGGHNCGVKSDGTVACWGRNNVGQATPPAGTFTQVSVGNHTCGVRSDGSVACWGAGSNLYGQATPPAGSFVQVDAGLYHTCGVKSDGSVACWGDNSSGEATPPAGAFTQVSAGAAYTCGLRSDSTVACWGHNYHGRATPPVGAFGITTYTLTVINTGSGAGAVTSAPTGINCGSDCGETYGSSTVVTLTATPASGSTFTGWSGACSGAGVCQITMDQDRAVTATFNDRASLIVVKTGSGSGHVTSNPAGIDCGNDCSENYPVNTLVRLMATPATGSSFTGWSGACTGTGACEVSMMQARSVIATFALPNYALGVRKTGNGSGMVTSSPAGIDCGGDCAQDYAKGVKVKLTAKAKSGSVFAGWSGACSGTAHSCNVTMSEAKTVTAAFTKKGYYLLTVSKAGSGRGAVKSSPSGISCGSDCNHSYRKGTTVKLTAKASSGSTFAGWKGSCSGRSATCQLTMSKTRSVTATFNRRGAAAADELLEWLNSSASGGDELGSELFPGDSRP